ncbi:hypothetical protein ACFL54_08765 [Planctomycetota bacterium]
MKKTKFGLLFIILCISLTGCLDGQQDADSPSSVNQASMASNSEEYTVKINDSDSGFSDLDSFDGGLEYGEIKGDFRIAIRPDKNTYKFGEEIKLTLFLENTSNNTRAIAGMPDLASLELLAPFLSITITRTENDSAFSYNRGTYPAGCAGRQYNFKVKPGRKLNSRIGILTTPERQLKDEKGQKRLIPLQEGEHHIQLEYTGVKGYTLKSNITTIQLRDHD